MTLKITSNLLTNRMFTLLTLEKEFLPSLDSTSLLMNSTQRLSNPTSRTGTHGPKTDLKLRKKLEMMMLNLSLMDGSL